MTYNRFVSNPIQIKSVPDCLLEWRTRRRGRRKERTERMTAAQLRLLGVLGLELVANAVEELDVALLRVLLQRRDEGPGHGSCGLAGDLCVLPISEKSLVIRSLTNIFKEYIEEWGQGQTVVEGTRLTKSAYPWNQTTSRRPPGKSWFVGLFRSWPRLWWPS